MQPRIVILPIVDDGVGGHVAHGRVRDAYETVVGVIGCSSQHRRGADNLVLATFEMSHIYVAYNSKHGTVLVAVAAVELVATVAITADHERPWAIVGRIAIRLGDNVNGLASGALQYERCEY
jgi:hypothetical protein